MIIGRGTSDDPLRSVCAKCGGILGGLHFCPSTGSEQTRGSAKEPAPTLGRATPKEKA